MKLKELAIEDLEAMTYDEIAYQILLEGGRKQKLLTLYEKICKLLKLDFQKEKDNIADFFGTLSTNKKFIMLGNGYWDLQINHKTNIVVDNSIEEIDDEEIEEEIEEDSDIENENIFYESNAGDDTAEDDLADLAVITDEDETN